MVASPGECDNDAGATVLGSGTEKRRRALEREGGREGGKGRLNNPRGVAEN